MKFSYNYLLKLIFGLLCLSISLGAHANNGRFSQRHDVQIFISSMVKQHHFAKKSLEQVFDQVNLQPAIIASITKPYEDKTWDEYQQLFITQERIDKGMAFWQHNQAVLTKAQQLYGVPANIIIAILGVETLYGERKGEYRVIDALSTLAFAYPPRAKFFKKELAELFLLSREQHFNPLTIKGSYAGAIGYPQFMPSSYRHFAIDFSGGNHSDLNNNSQDVIFSIANYIKQHGWNPQQPIAIPAKINGRQFQQVNVDAKFTSYTLNQLLHLGISPIYPQNQAPLKAGVIRLDRKNQAEYWICFDNFYVITRYNTSKQYAMAVYQLASILNERYTKK